MSIQFTGDVCEDGLVPVILTVAFVLVILLGGRWIMRLEVSARAQSKKLAREESGWKNMSWLEDWLVTPFVPTSLEVFACYLFVWAFSQTVTMAFTRGMLGRWENQFITQQWLQNFISVRVFGCAPLSDGNVTVITYAYEGEPPSDSRGRTLKSVNPLEYRVGIDSHIGFHLAMGLSWLTLGAMQVALARSGWSRDAQVRHKAHRWFGYFATLVFACHMIGAAKTLAYDVAHHTIFIKCLLLSDIVMSVFYVTGALFFMHYRRNYAMHTTLMFYGYLQSIEGSGTIRTAGWLLWMVAKFVPEDFAIVWLDSTKCQQQSIRGYPNFDVGPTWIGSAQYCYFPYALRLQLMRMITIYYKAIFMRLPMNEYKKNARRLVLEEAYWQMVKMGVACVVMISVALAPARFRDAFEPYRALRTFFWTTFATGFWMWDMYSRIRDLWLAFLQDEAELSASMHSKGGLTPEERYEMDKVLELHATDMERDLKRLQSEADKKQKELAAIRKKIK